MVIYYMDFTAPLPLFLISASHSGAKTLSFQRPGRWNQSKKTLKWPTLFYSVFWSNGLAETNFLNADENNLLHLCHYSLRELKGSKICVSFKKTANVIDVKFRVVSLTNSRSLPFKKLSWPPVLESNWSKLVLHFSFKMERICLWSSLGMN